jgi:hypothetical protein
MIDPAILSISRLLLDILIFHYFSGVIDYIQQSE